MLRKTRGLAVERQARGRDGEARYSHGAANGDREGDLAPVQQLDGLSGAWCPVSVEPGGDDGGGISVVIACPRALGRTGHHVHARHRGAVWHHRLLPQSPPRRASVLLFIHIFFRRCGTAEADPPLASWRISITPLWPCPALWIDQQRWPAAHRAID